MSAERAIYIDSSAIVKLVIAEPESASLRRYLRRRGPLVVSSLARTEVGRALLPLGPVAVRRGIDVLARLDLIRVSDRILADAATQMPANLRSLDAIHLATIRQLGASITRVLTYDERMSRAVGAVGLTVVAPS
jgi:predicted nucleic acid-binding protein